MRTAFEKVTQARQLVGQIGGGPAGLEGFEQQDIRRIKQADELLGTAQMAISSIAKKR